MKQELQAEIQRLQDKEKEDLAEQRRQAALESQSSEPQLGPEYLYKMHKQQIDCLTAI